nr:inhibitor of nuclear factor kappa-B kinase subunit alpha [Arenicola marina]
MDAATYEQYRHGAQGYMPQNAANGAGGGENVEWIRVKLLGQGGFGEVTLWKHKHTGEHLCLKTCRVTTELTETHRTQWQKECDIMLKLQCDNIVRGLVTPAELASRCAGLPALAMEFCSGGDLRKVLFKPENCCGLPEAQVRSVARDVNGAVEYLHTRGVIHRDIKPENVVLQPVDAHKVIYKLIDLGYAKDVSQGSICKSFVGTAQYLAPELFFQKPYTQNVDYWCLGTTVFECIVGQRPFFHGVPPMRWLYDVAKKSPDEICGYFDLTDNARPVFTQEIPQPNQLCSLSQSYFQQWLRLMLQWDPKHRGGGKTSTGRQACFKILEQIINFKLVRVFSVATNELRCYPLSNQDLSLLQIQQVLERDTRIPVAEQELLLMNGTSPDPNKSASSYASAMDEDEDTVLYLFHVGPAGARRAQSVPSRQSPILQMMMQHHRQAAASPLPYDIRKKAYAHAVSYIRECSKHHTHLTEAHRAASVSLIRNKAEFSKEKQPLSSDFEDLKAKIDFFDHSLAFDLDKLQKQQSSGIYSSKMHSLWRQTKTEVSKLAALEEDLARLDQRCERLEAQVAELQRNPLARQRQDELLLQSENQAVLLYDTLRKLTREKRQTEMLDVSEMVQCVNKHLTETQHLTGSLQSHIWGLLSCRKEVLLLRAKAQELHHRTREAREKVVSFQKQRQKDIWGMVSTAMKQASQGSLQQSQGPSQPLTRSGSGGIAPSPTGGGGADWLLQENPEQSLILRAESAASVQRLNATMDRCREDNSLSACDSLDWTFLSLRPQNGAT